LDGDKNRNLMRRFFYNFNIGFNAVRSKYVNSLSFLLKYKWITAVVLVASVVGVVLINRAMPTGFIPSEDRGVIFMNIELPEGASYDRTYQVLQTLNEKLNDFDEINGKTLYGGRNFFSGGGSSYGMGFLLLKKWEEREAEESTVTGLIARLSRVAQTIPDANIIFFSPPSVRGFGSADGFQLEHLDRTGGSFKDLDEAATGFVQALLAEPSIGFASNSFSTNFPQYELEVNVPKAKEAGVTVSSILSTLQGYIGGFYAADFSRFGKQYRVYIQSLPEDRRELADLDRIMVRNEEGQMAPVTEFVHLERIYGPQTVNRF